MADVLLHELLYINTLRPLEPRWQIGVQNQNNNNPSLSNPSSSSFLMFTFFNSQSRNPSPHFQQSLWCFGIVFFGARIRNLVPSMVNLFGNWILGPRFEFSLGIWGGIGSFFGSFECAAGDAKFLLVSEEFYLSFCSSVCALSKVLLAYFVCCCFIW